MGVPVEIRQADRQAQARARALAEQQEDRRRRQVAFLLQLDCLRGVSSLELLRLAHLCTLRVFPIGSQIQGERTVNEFLYLVLRGTISLKLHDRDGYEALVGVLGRGDCFGEGPLFGDLFRGATVYAETACYLIQLPLAEVKTLIADAPELRAVLRATYRRRLVEQSLGRVPLFSKLTPFERSGLAGLLQPRHFARGAQILQYAAPGDALYLIESGQAVVERHGQTIAYLDEGDFFGEISLLTGQPHNADIRAITPVDVLTLPATELRSLLDRQPILAEQLQAAAEQRRASSATLQNDHARAQRLALIVDHGMLRGSRLLVRDQNLCVDGCRICEDACAARHGHPRIRVQGTKIDTLDITDTCRQCRVGAECVEACPEDAIDWNTRGALVITDRCTGCGDCVPACPYHAVRLVNRPPVEDQSPLWTLWRRLKQWRTPAIALEPLRPTQRADKCDLCDGYDDLACVSACPTGALRLVPVEELFPL